MPINVRATFDQAELEEAIQWIENMGHRARASIAFQAPQIKRIIQAEILANFETESFYGIPWPALSPITLATKMRLQDPSLPATTVRRDVGPEIQGEEDDADVPIGTKLVETGRLFRSLIRDTEDTIYAVAPNSLLFGTAVPYAAAQLQGGPGPARNTRIPPRPYMPRLGPLADEIAEGIADHVVEG